MTRKEKLKKLHSVLLQYKGVGIAFSGGIDSSFLLKTALNTLGGKNVLILRCRSCLQKQREQEQAATWLKRHGYDGRQILEKIIDHTPLADPLFVQNSPERCYLCKRRMYSLFIKQLSQNGFTTLLDGTNFDDLSAHRPGMQAIKELGIKTPLADCKLSKAEIRFSSQELGLDNSQQPASSCLATRLPHLVPITSNLLRRIEQIEEIIHEHGIPDCRARFSGTDTSRFEIHLPPTAIKQLNNDKLKHSLQEQLASLNITYTIFLDLAE